MVPYLEPLGQIQVVGGRIVLAISWGVCNHRRVPFPKAPSLSKALAQVVRMIGKPLEAEASLVRLAWEGMSLIWPSLQSHTEGLPHKCAFSVILRFLSDILAGEVQ